MSSANYLYGPAVFSKRTFRQIARDTKVVLKVLEKMGLELAGPDGTGKPVISDEIIAFNGCRKCTNARPVAFAESECNGKNCSAEAFVLKRVLSGREKELSYTGRVFYRENPRVAHKYFRSCRTEYRPYDFAVKSVLVIVKHYMGDKVVVSSNANMKTWERVILFVHLVLNWNGGGTP